MLHHTLHNPTLPGRVVVIGAAGFVGGAVKRRLEMAGVPVLGLGRRDIDLLAVDAAERLSALLRPDDAVVAAAARAPCKNFEMLIENMTMTQAMVEAIARGSVSHVVNISSDAVYGDDALPLTERSPTAPGSLHGVMHLGREIAFRDGVVAPLAILRPTLIYGAADPHNGYGPNRFRRQAEAGQAIALFGEGEERRDHVHIDDVAEVILRTLLHRSTGTLNIATGEVHSFRAIADWAVGEVGAKGAITSSPRSGPMPHNGYRPFDVTSLRTAFPDFSPIGLREGMARSTGDEEKNRAAG